MLNNDSRTVQHKINRVIGAFAYVIVPSRTAPMIALAFALRHPKLSTKQSQSEAEISVSEPAHTRTTGL
jgi:hypothetical protein